MHFKVNGLYCTMFTASLYSNGNKNLSTWRNDLGQSSRPAYDKQSFSIGALLLYSPNPTSPTPTSLTPNVIHPNTNFCTDLAVLNLIT